MPYTPNTTWVDGSGGGTPISAARLNNIEAGVAWTWDTYTPTWSSSGSAVVIGNGVLSGKYIQRGKWVTGQALLRIGSSSTLGSGIYMLSLPVTSVAVTYPVLGSGYVWDNSASSLWTASSFQVTTTTMRANITAVTNYAVGQGVPMTFATGDEINFQFSYEAA